MTKKVSFFVVALAAIIFVFAGCGTTYKFTALLNNPSADSEVKGNGGIYVEKGDYSYFVNGIMAQISVNKFGEIVKGGICRVKTADIGKEDALVEVVVPKVIYAVDVASDGFYIYGDKIYYTTPNSDKDKNGVIQSDKLDVMSVKLDGTGTKKLLTLDSNKIEFSFVQAVNNVYFVYVEDTTLKLLDTTSKATVDVKKNVAKVVFDRKNENVFFVHNPQRKDIKDEDVAEKYDELFVLKKGSKEPTLLISGKNVAEGAVENDQDKYTLMHEQDGKVFFTKSNEFKKSTHLHVIEAESKSSTIVARTSEHTVFFYEAKGTEHILYAQVGGLIKKLTFSATGENVGGIAPTLTSATVTGFMFGLGNDIYYKTDGIVYSFDKTVSRQTASKALTDAPMATDWLDVDYMIRDGKAEFYILDNTVEDSVVKGYFAKITYDFAEKKIINTRIAKLTTADQKLADEEAAKKR